jgi:hypothetical protein
LLTPKRRQEIQNLSTENKSLSSTAIAYKRGIKHAKTYIMTRSFVLLFILFQTISVPSISGQPRLSYDMAKTTENPNTMRRIPEQPSGRPASRNNEKIAGAVTLLEAYNEQEAYAMYSHFLAGNGEVEALRDWIRRHPEVVHLRDRTHQWTALHEAARGGHVEVADLLLESGADVNARNRYGGTPLFEAGIHHGLDSAIYQYLVARGAVSEESKARRLRGGSSSKIPIQDTAHGLAAKGHVVELNHRLDLEGPALLDRQDENGWTLLHEAARTNQVPMARFLVIHGADLHIRSIEGLTPLELAESFLGKEADMYQYLLKEEQLHDRRR